MNIDLLVQGIPVKSTYLSIGVPSIGLLNIKGENYLIDCGGPNIRTQVLKGLKERNLRPKDINKVILTHLHWDHCLNVDLFPNATFLIPKNEWEYVQSPSPEDWATLQYTASIFNNYKIELIEDGEKIAENVKVIETPGHSPGFMSIIIKQEEHNIAFAGDAITNASSFLNGTPDLVFYDNDKAKKSVERLKNTCSVIYPGHDRPFKMENGKLKYLVETSFDLELFFSPKEGSTKIYFSS